MIVSRPFLGLAVFLSLLSAPVAKAAADDVGIETNSAGGAAIRLLSGLETVRYDANKIIVYRGSAADNAARSVMQVERSLILDITKVGPGGRDDAATERDVEIYGNRLATDAERPSGVAARLRSGPEAGRPLPGWYYVVLLQDEARAHPPTAILTRQQTSIRRDRRGDAHVPEQYALRRHLPIAFYYGAESGFRPMTCYGWPKPVCDWTRSEKREHYRIVGDLASVKSRAVDASEWLPGYGRILRLEVVTRSVGGRGGSYVQTRVGPGGEFMAGYVNNGGDVSVVHLELATASNRTFAVRTDPGVVVDIYAVGFTIAQPS